MRVLLVNKFLYARGGAERAVLDLGASLAARGHDVFYFGMQHADNVVSGPNVGVVSWRDYRADGWRRIRDAASMWYSLAARRAFRDLVARVRPDVVHAHNIYHQLTPSILDAAAAGGVPVVMTLHDYKLVCPRYDLLRHGRVCDACIESSVLACVRYRCAGGLVASVVLAGESALHRLRDSYACVRRFLAPSRFLLEVMRRGGIEPQRLQHVPNFAPRADEAGLAAGGDDERFVFVGRLSPEKGVETLVRACLGLSHGRLIVCGTGPLEHHLHELARDAAPDRITFRGHLSRAAVAQELGAARFSVVPSEWFENAPFSVLESMAQGRAVLASNLGGLPELVQHQRSGFLVAPGDVQAWQATLERALGDPEMMRQMGVQARIDVLQRNDLEQHVCTVEAIYREVAA